MSVLVTIKVRGNTDVFRKALADRADDFAKSGEEARSQGALHHRFGIGDGFVHVIDEWETAEQFEAFFARPELRAFMPEIGADLSIPPEIIISEPVASSDEF